MKQKFLLLLLFALAFADTGKIDQKISKTEKELSKKQHELETTSLTLEELGKSIVRQQKDVNLLTKKLDNLSVSIREDKEKLIRKEKTKEELLAKRREALDKRNALEQKLIDIIVNDLAYSEIIAQEGKTSNAKDIVQKEIFAKLKDMVLSQSKELKEEFARYVIEVRDLDNEIAAINKEIGQLRDAKNEVSTLKEKKEAQLAKLNREKTIYKKRLTSLMREQESSQDLLDQLKLTKKELIAKEKERQRRAEAERKERERQAREERTEATKPADTSGITVRKVGSSYQDVDITHLRLTKVKAPLDDFKVVKKFGSYHDPVYNIKIHNDSISLKPDRRDSVVRSVLGGKVIFAKDYNVLGKTVVIEHHNNILTFYSNLSTIAPGIKPGKKINARTAVGRVDEELKFKVTKGTTLVDPLELIRI